MNGFEGRKTGLFKPVWGWDRFSEAGGRKKGKRPVLGVSGFRVGLLSLLGKTGEIMVIRQKMEKYYEILFNSRHIMLLRL